LKSEKRTCHRAKSIHYICYSAVFIIAGILLIVSSIPIKLRQAHLEKIKAELNALFPENYTLEVIESKTYDMMYDVTLGLGNSNGLYDHDFNCGIAGIEAIEAIAQYMTESEEAIAVLNYHFMIQLTNLIRHHSILSISAQTTSPLR
jgi:hypothetical protein